MAKPLPLRVWDRTSRKIVNEFMEDSKSTYEARPGRSPTQWLESEPLYDWLVSAWNNSRFSVRKIEPFIKKHHIDMSEFEPVIYRSYAEFFTRRFKPGKRSFPRTLGEMGAFAEARYFGWSNVTSGQRFPIKGKSLDPDAILGQKSKTYAQFFEGGPVIMARLAPVDYHHLHYPDSGATVDHYHEGRPIWTINWRALQSKDDILIKNERCIHILQTDNFGRLGFVEIGAMTVGRIVQVHAIDKPYERGEEKSFFCFGGSAVILFGEPGRWLPSQDILANTKNKVETRVLLGEPIARTSS
jgi:phosphatidylserine decarboxylase